MGETGTLEVLHSEIPKKFNERNENMKNIWKRSLSMFLALAMVFSLLPMNVFASSWVVGGCFEHQYNSTTGICVYCDAQCKHEDFANDVCGV